MVQKYFSILLYFNMTAFVGVSLHLESRSRKALEKHYLFRGSYNLSFFFFLK